MNEVASLVKKPTVDDEIKSDIVKILEDTLAEAKSGDVGAIFMIVERADTMWTERWNGTVRMSEMIGRLEIIKHKIIHQYFQNENEL